jgi:hypothetical protein
MGNGGLKLICRRGGRGDSAGSPMLNVLLATKFRRAPNPLKSEISIRQMG